jgi:hypothetical protein
MKNGDVVFFKEAREGSGRKARTMKFKGHAFGVLLGHVPPFAKDPPPEHLLRLMGTIGFVSFDDVAAFLGDENAQKCVTMFEDKYYGKAAQDAAPEVAPEEAAQPSGLLGADGQPMPTKLQAVAPQIDQGTIAEDAHEADNEISH